MGIERARVVEVHAPTSSIGRVGSGYLVDDRLVLTAGGLAGRSGPTHVRPAGTATWLAASSVWCAPGTAGAAIVELDEPAALLMPAGGQRWGLLGGRRPVAVTAMGFPPTDGRPQFCRDAEQFRGEVVPEGDGPLPVWAVAGSHPAGEGMTGAALFAGAELVGVLLGGGAGATRAVPVQAMADDEEFVHVVGAGRGLPLVPVSAPGFGFPILPVG